MARIPYPDPDTFDADTRSLLDKLPPLNLFRMMAGGGALLNNFVRLGNHLLFKSELDPVLRELAIIRVGVLSGARYEVYQHEAIARTMNIDEAVIAGIHAGPDDGAFDDIQRLALRFTDDVVANVRASDDTFVPLVAALSSRQVQELTVTIGYYMMVSRYLATFGIEIEGEPGSD